MSDTSTKISTQESELRTFNDDINIGRGLVAVAWGLVAVAEALKSR